MNQLNMFGEKIEIECGKDDNIYIKTTGDAGKMQVRMKEDDIVEYAYDDEVHLKMEYSVRYMAMFAKFSKLNSVCSIHLSKNQPLKLLYNLNSWMETEEDEEVVNVNYIRFYLAPQVNDEDEED